MDNLSREGMQPADMKIARQRHKKTEHISKIVMYWACPEIFMTIRPNLATGSTKNQKKAILDNESSGHQYAHGILLYLGPDIVPGNFLCMDIEGKGSV